MIWDAALWLWESHEALLTPDSWSTLYLHWGVESYPLRPGVGADQAQANIWLMNRVESGVAPVGTSTHTDPLWRRFDPNWLTILDRLLSVTHDRLFIDIDFLIVPLLLVQQKQALGSSLLV